MSYRYHTPAEYHQLILETEAEMDRREAQWANDRRMQAITAFINDPKNKALIDADPMVQALRANKAIDERRQPVVPPNTPSRSLAPQRTAPPARAGGHQYRNPPPPADAQVIGFSNAAKDPHVGSPSAKSKSAAPVRYGPGAPAIPPNGFWVL